MEKDCKFFDLPRSLTGKYYTGSTEVFYHMSKIPWKRDTCKISRYVTRNNGFSDKTEILTAMSLEGQFQLRCKASGIGFGLSLKIMVSPKLTLH